MIENIEYMTDVKAGTVTAWVRGMRNSPIVVATDKEQARLKLEHALMEK